MTTTETTSIAGDSFEDLYQKTTGIQCYLKNYLVLPKLPYSCSKDFLKIIY